MINGSDIFLVPGEVVHLLLSPQAYNFARIQLAEAVFEAVVVLDIFVPVLKLIQGGLENLEDTLFWNNLLFKAVGDTTRVVLLNKCTFVLNVRLQLVAQ